MADVHSPETRSRNMAAIRSKDTKPELTVRRYLHRHGIRYSLHKSKLPGRPDLVLPKRNAVVFVHGCYWHRHPGCPKATTPATRPEFWIPKLEGNRERDLKHQAELEEKGWRVFIIWECQLNTKEHLEILAAALKDTT